METTLHCIAELKEKIADNALERNHLHDVTTLAAELKLLLVRNSMALTEAGVRKELEQLEIWLEAQRKGPAPACIISEGGITWLTALREKLKLSADEAQRLEGEGGNPSSKEQVQKTEELLQTIRRIDRIINESATAKPH